jgi:hypothetical protein
MRLFFNELLKGLKMSTQIGNIIFGQIKNVRKSGDDEGVYFADVEMQEAEGFPFETHIYCARSDDYAATGKWVYQQIIDGNIVGSITQLAPDTNPETGEPWDRTQPTTIGSQTL